MPTADLLQSAVVALIVLAAAAYLGSALWRTVSSARRGKEAGGCATGCGCGEGGSAARRLEAPEPPRGRPAGRRSARSMHS